MQIWRDGGHFAADGDGTDEFAEICDGCSVARRFPSLRDGRCTETAVRGLEMAAVRGFAPLPRPKSGDITLGTYYFAKRMVSEQQKQLACYLEWYNPSIIFEAIVVLTGHCFKDHMSMWSSCVKT